MTEEEFQVVFPAVFRPLLEDWLKQRGLYLFPIPIEDDLVTYGIGIENDGTDT